MIRRKSSRSTVRRPQKSDGAVAGSSGSSKKNRGKKTSGTRKVLLPWTSHRKSFPSSGDSGTDTETANANGKKRRLRRRRQSAPAGLPDEDSAAVHIATKLKDLRERKAKLDTKLEEARAQRTEEKRRRSESFDSSISLGSWIESVIDTSSLDGSGISVGSASGASSTASSRSRSKKHRVRLPLHLQQSANLLDSFEADQEVLPDNERYRISNIMGLKDFFPSEQFAKLAGAVSGVAGTAREPADEGTNNTGSGSSRRRNTGGNTGSDSALARAVDAKENNGVSAPFFSPTSPIQNGTASQASTPQRNASEQRIDESYFSPSDTSSPQHSVPSSTGSKPSPVIQKAAANSVSDDGTGKSAMHAAFLESADMWLATQKQTETPQQTLDRIESGGVSLATALPKLKSIPRANAKTSVGSASVEYILPPSPEASFDATFVDINSSAESADNQAAPGTIKTPVDIIKRPGQVKQAPAEPRADSTEVSGNTDKDIPAPRPPRHNGNSATELPINTRQSEKTDEKKLLRRQAETNKRSQMLQVELGTLLEETQKTMGHNLSDTIVKAVCQAAYLVTYTHKYFDATADDMMYYPTVMETLVDDERSLLFVKHIDRCYASLQDEKMMPAELITTLVMIAARLIPEETIGPSQRESMSMPVDITSTAMDDYVCVNIDPLPGDAVATVPADVAEPQSIPTSPEERRQRLSRIRMEVQLMLEEMKKELGVDMPQPAFGILVQAAENVAELSCYKDTQNGQTLYFPRVHAAIMDHTLMKVANDLYFVETGEEQFPLEYTSLLRIIAARKLEEDDTKYGRSLTEKEKLALPLQLEEKASGAVPASPPRPFEELIVPNNAEELVESPNSLGSPPRVHRIIRYVDEKNTSEHASRDMSEITTFAPTKHASGVSNEAVMSGDKDHNDTLESLVTQPRLPVKKRAESTLPINSGNKKSTRDDADVLNVQYEYFSRNTWSSPWSRVASEAGCVTAEAIMRDVYVKDREFAWLPAKVLRYDPDGAVITITEPEDWEDTTIDSERLFADSRGQHSSLSSLSSDDLDSLMKEYGIRNRCTLRKVLFEDYVDGELPQQNSIVGRTAKPDLADLVHLHDAAILYNLKLRHSQSKPYSRVGDIIIAMNPFRWINHLYSSETRDAYANFYIWDFKEGAGMACGDDGTIATGLSEHVLTEGLSNSLDPHVYETSSLAYRGLATGGQDQTILVTGESGAGKTETAKIVITHLATVQQTRPEGIESDHVTAEEIVSRVCRSSPVFEAFGNAKTVRNGNSSRFGKFIQLQFVLEPEDASINAGRDIPYTDLVGSRCITYLLEKTRVVHHDEGERSYHIFYQLLAAPKSVKESVFEGFGNASVEDFAYLAQSGSPPNSLEDEDSWHSTCAALKLFKIDGARLDELMRALLIILQLGNLSFEEVDDQSTRVSSIHELRKLSKMTGLSSEELATAMTSKVLRTPGNSDDVRVALSEQAAREARDAVAKDIYAALFDGIIASMNEFTSFDADNLGCGQSMGHISLLDIFGFENFETNRFEQFCINYANEKLHNMYVRDNFNLIKNEYEEEGIDLYDFSLVDNADILDMLEGKDGLISSLNEECLRPQGTAENFVSKNKAAFRGSRRLLDRKLHRRIEFGLLHFASPVEYDARDFLHRNMDTISDDLAVCASKMKNDFISKSFQTTLASRATEELGRSQTTLKKKRARSYVAEKFREQLHGLMDAMAGSRTRYIRCIKPNNASTPKMTEHSTTLYQLQCSGLITAIQISRESFPTAQPYERVLSRYAMLVEGGEAQQLCSLGAAEKREKVNQLLASWLLVLSKRNPNGTCILPYACGKTKVYFKPGAQERLEELRRRYFDKRATVIQRRYRGRQERRRFATKKAAAVLMQKISRTYLARRQLSRAKSAATSISAWYRCAQCAAAFQTLSAAAITVQAARRGIVDRRLAAHLRRERAATIIALWFRVVLACRIATVRRADRAALKIQCLARQSSARSALTLLRREKAAVTIQSSARTVPLRREYSRMLHAVEVLQKQARHMLAINLMNKRLIALAKVARMTKAAGSTQQDVATADDGLREGVPPAASNVNMLSETMERMTREMDELRMRNQQLQQDLVTSQRMNQDLKERAERAESSGISARSRVAELQKINEGLAKKVFEFKGENTHLRRTYQSRNLQINHKLAVAEKKLSSMAAARDVQIAGLKEDMRRQHKLATQEIEAVRQEKELAEARHKAEMKKQEDELKKVQASHHQYLKDIMAVLEKTRAAREAETKRINEDMKNMQRRKNEQIVALHKEIAELKKATAKPNAPSPPISQERMKVIQARLEKEAEARARRSAQVDDVVQDIYRIADNALPEDIGSVISDSVELLHHLFRIEENSQSKEDQKSLRLVESYTETVKPDATISKLKDRLLDSLDEVKKLKAEVDRLSPCKRCAAIDARIAARSHASAAVPGASKSNV